MTRTAISLPLADLQTFARSLAAELPAPPPGHLSLLNMLARAAGFRNFQHLRASHKAGEGLATEALAEPPAEPLPDLTRVAAALRHFDGTGQMTSWPARTAVQHLCLWALWSRLPKDVLSERQISQHLDAAHSFGDAALLRRTLIELHLVTRSTGSTAYTRIERPPTPEARALIRALCPKLALQPKLAPLAPSLRHKYPTGGNGGA